MIADYDHETIVNLYQPIVGFTAISLYFTLLYMGKNQRAFSFTKHEDLLMKMQITSGDFIEARKYLEAVGLLRTHYVKQDSAVIYYYDIFAPRTPFQFFDNALLYGMLIKCLGVDAAQKLRDLYPAANVTEIGEDISCKFTDVFHPSFDDEAFGTALKDETKAKGRNVSKIRGVFSYEIFFKNLGEVSQIKPESIEKKEMKEIYRLATLYGVDELAAANYVASIFDPFQPKGKHVDMKALASMFQKEADYTFTVKKVKPTSPNLVSSETDLASKINFMETVSPKKFLTALQGGTTPAAADMRLIDDLSKNFNLNNAVINALIDYVLSSCDNVLSRSYAEKVAASLAREGVTTTIDAMNYLLRANKQNRKINGKVDAKDTKNENISINNKENNTQDDGPSWDELLDEIDQGGSDGKA